MAPLTAEEKKAKAAKKKEMKKLKKAAAATGGGVLPPPKAHANTLPPRKGGPQVSGTVPTLCYLYQTQHNGGRYCTDHTDPQRGCKFTHKKVKNLDEFKALSVPGFIKSEQKKQERLLKEKKEQGGRRTPTTPRTPARRRNTTVSLQFQ